MPLSGPEAQSPQCLSDPPGRAALCSPLDRWPGREWGGVPTGRGASPAPGRTGTSVDRALLPARPAHESVCVLEHPRVSFLSSSSILSRPRVSSHLSCPPSGREAQSEGLAKAGAWGERCVCECAFTCVYVHTSE